MKKQPERVIEELQNEIMKKQSVRKGARIKPEIIQALIDGNRTGIDERQVLRDKSFRKQKGK